VVRDAEDAQQSYNIFSDIFLNFYDLHFPVKTRKFNRNFHKIEPWMTNGLLISRKNKLKLSSLSSRNPTALNVQNYTNYRNLYNRILKAAKRKFYDDEFAKNTNNLKKSWDLINSAINSGGNKII